MFSVDDGNRSEQGEMVSARGSAMSWDGYRNLQYDLVESSENSAQGYLMVGSTCGQYDGCSYPVLEDHQRTGHSRPKEVGCRHERETKENRLNFWRPAVLAKSYVRHQTCLCFPEWGVSTGQEHNSWLAWRTWMVPA